MNARAKRIFNQHKSGVRTVSPARKCALDALRKVEDERAFASVVLATSVEKLQANDRALCYEIVLGCLRWQLWLDSCLAYFSGRDPAKLDAEVRRALRAGLYQLRFLTRIPASAVVNETVIHVRASGFSSAAGFANAVLRRAAREADYDPVANVTDEVERLSIATSHTPFLIRRWIRMFGKQETEALAHANNRLPPVSFRINQQHQRASGALAELKDAGGKIINSEIASGAWRIEGAQVKLRELEAMGAIYVQSEASQLVTHALDAKRGERILDACAAPGSKTTHVAMLTANRATIIAGDVHAHRLRLLQRLAARQELSAIHAVAFDAGTALPFQDAIFDRVLVDAPCTGTGTLRHNPEIRWRVTGEQIKQLAALQLNVLREAARVVRPRGRLVYSTCSIEPEENEEVVAAFLRLCPEWHTVVAALPAALCTETGAARTFPHRHDTDGFFVQVLEKQG